MICLPLLYNCKEKAAGMEWRTDDEDHSEHFGRFAALLTSISELGQAVKNQTAAAAALVARRQW